MAAWHAPSVSAGTPPLTAQTCQMRQDLSRRGPPLPRTRSAPWLQATAAALILGGCASRRGGAAAAAPRPVPIPTATDLVPTAGGRATPARAIPLVPGDAATAAQLALAHQQGQATTEELMWAIARESASTGTLHAGPYTITYLVTPPLAYYEPEALPGRLTLHNEVAPGMVHLGAVVRDAADGRLVPGLLVRATLGGRTVTLPFGWYPTLDRYGENVQLPQGGPFTLRIDVAPATYPRHDSANGDRFSRPVAAEFAGISIPVTSLEHSAERAAYAPPAAQLRLARAEGASVRRATDALLATARPSVGQRRAGNFEVAIAAGPPSSLWTVAGGALRYHAHPATGGANDVHLDVVVRDVRTGRFLPGLPVTATVLDARGRAAWSGALPFMWHPWLSHYGSNVRLRATGRYTVRVHIGAPPFRRYMPNEIGRGEFVHPEDVVFRKLPITVIR